MWLFEFNKVGAPLLQAAPAEARRGNDRVVVAPSFSCRDMRGFRLKSSKKLARRDENRVVGPSLGSFTSKISLSDAPFSL